MRAMVQPRARPDMLDIPFPLRDDLVLSIRNLPLDLPPREAERLAAFLRTLAIPENLAPASPEKEITP